MILGIVDGSSRHGDMLDRHRGLLAGWYHMDDVRPTSVYTILGKTRPSEPSLWLYPAMLRSRDLSSHTCAWCNKLISSSSSISSNHSDV